MTATRLPRLRVAVLMGGWAHEREVSLMSGKGVARALEQLGHEAIPIDLDRQIARRLIEARPDIVFNALHGVPGEDGTVQGMLDLMGIAYTHSPLATSVIAIDKQLTKLVLVPHGIPMPEGRIVSVEELFAGDPMERPYVLKPVNEGSSVGVAIVTEDSGHGKPVSRDAEGPWKQFAQLLAEPFIPGRELTSAVLDTPQGPRALGVTELRVSKGFYDYEAKYTEGKTQHICPAPIPPRIAERCMELALKAHEVLGCRGTSRTDFRWDEPRGIDGLFVLETNTQPGMTPLSLVPEQARAQGIDYPALVEAILAEAWSRAGAGLRQGQERQGQDFGGKSGHGNG